MISKADRPLLVVVTLLFGAHLFWQWGSVMSLCDMEGDISLLLLATERAGRFEQLVGPYSRFHFSHPGPVVFYWYALVAFLSSAFITPAGALVVAQTILNAVACFCVARMVLLESTLAVSGVLLLMICTVLFFSGTNTAFLHYAWNPVAVLFPLLAFLFSAGSLASGRREAAPQLVLWWVIAVHHHVAAGAFASLIGVFASLVAIVQHGWRPWRDWPGRSAIAIGILFGALPIVIEALTHPRGGNLVRLIRFFTRPFERLPWQEVVDVTLQGMVPLDVSAPGAIAIGMFLVGAPWLRALDSAPFERALRLIAGVAFLSGILAARGIRGTPHDYLLWFLFPLGALNAWLCVYHVVAALPLSKWLLHGVFGLLALAVLVRSGRQPVHLGGVCWGLGEPVRRALVESHAGESPVMISPRGKGGWAAAAEIVLALTRAGVPFCVERRWSFMFGRKVACPMEETLRGRQLIITPKQCWQSEKAFTTIAQSGKMSVLLEAR
jgi:hypothetical protein